KLRDQAFGFGNPEQERQAVAEDDEVSEHTAENEQPARSDEQRAGPATLVAVEARRDEAPKLKKHPRRTEKDRTHNRQLDPDDLERVHRVEHEQMFREAGRSERLRRGTLDEAP